VVSIIGKLVFPNDGSYTLTINTASIIVQGELDLQATQTPVTGTPMIRIVMIGMDKNLSFIPVNENANACQGFFGNCKVGQKSITVAGGKVTRTCILSNFVVDFFVRCYLNIHFKKKNDFHGISSRHTIGCTNLGEIIQRRWWNNE
jgi:hypothetical protein